MKIFKWLLVCLMITGCHVAKEKENVKVEKDDQKVSMVAVGDNLMHQRLLDVAYQEGHYDFSPYYANIQSFIQKADLAFVNQETILGGESLGYSGYPLFNTPDEMAQTLDDVGFDIVNGATNHSFDKGEKAIQHSIELFKSFKNMTYIGLYDSQEERDTVQVVEKNGIKIAFLSYNQLTNGNVVPHSYTYNPFDKDLMKKDVENAKEISDIIVVSCHFGNEYETTPNDFQKEYAQYLTDLGVDIIIGTHTHTLQPVEWLEGNDGHRTLVAYSLGNFISGMMEEETQLGGMLSFDLVKKDNQVSVDNVTLTPLANHYTVDNVQNAYETRNHFTVYRLKDYTENLASQHGLNGYEGITISKDKMIQKVKERMSDSTEIKIDL